MVDTSVVPSELHLKKELTVLQKARFLRDPETCSSWRSPLSSKSFSASYILNCGNGADGNSGENGAGKMFQIPSNESLRKSVYLCNWKNHSSKSNDSGIKLDDDDRHISLEDSVYNPHKVNSTSDKYLEAPGAPVRRTAKKLRKAISKKQMIKHSSVMELLDPPSTSLGVLSSVEQSDDTEYCNSDDLLQLTHVLTDKTANHSPSVSPLFSGSGCGNWSYSSKILRSTRKQGSSHSCTPASTSSYYRYGGQNSSMVESLDGTTTSIDGDELDQLDLPTNQGCGIPCYWGKRSKERGSGGSYSPSLSDTLRRKGSSFFCASQSLYNKKRSPSSHKQKYISKSSQGLPLLGNSCHGGNSSFDTSSDELLTNYGELGLEASSRLDGGRWSSCKSQEGLQSVHSTEAEMDTADHKSLSQKYCPKSFDEIVGQNIVVHSLNNAITRERISPAYLFQGPRGTGKTSTARIFAAALNCLSTDNNKPCGFCGECTSIFSGSGSNVREVDAINKKGIDNVRYLLKNMSSAKAVSRYKVFIIDECHMLSSRMWSAFMNFLQEPRSCLVFIFITIDPDSLPRAVMSHCQKYLFSKVKDIDIVSRLRKMAYEENLDIEVDALDLIALNSDGSLRDAETMLDQLSLLGKRITISLVNELVGVVSDEKLLELLEIAMSSDTAETVKRSRELMDSGVDPVALMSQLAVLIMDIIAGSRELANSQFSGTALGGKSLSEDELKRLQQALKILSDAEKQLRLSSERSTWFTAALLQLGSCRSAEFTQSSSSSKHSTKEGIDSRAKESSFTVQGSSSALISRATSGYSSPHSCAPSYKSPGVEKFTSDILPANTRSVCRLKGVNGTDDTRSEKAITCISPDKLASIWRRCIQRCNSETLRLLLSSHGKLISITETENALIASIVFEDVNASSRAGRYLSSITNSIEKVLQRRVEVRIGLMSEDHKARLRSMPDSPSSNRMEMDGLAAETNRNSSSSRVSCNRHGGTPSLPRKRLDCSATLQKTLEQGVNSLVQDGGFKATSLVMLSDGNNEANGNGGSVKGMLALKKPTNTSDEHRLECAWLQTSDKKSLELASHPNRNQILPQNGVSSENHKKSYAVLAISSEDWKDELNHEIKTLKVSDSQGHHKNQIDGRFDHHVISPSLLHSNGITANSDRENMGYESGPCCSGLFCWSHKSYKMKVKKGIQGQTPKTRRHLCLGSSRSMASRSKARK